MFAHRQLTWSGLVGAFREALTDMGMIMMIIVMSGILGFATILEQAPQNIAQGMVALTADPPWPSPWSWCSC